MNQNKPKQVRIKHETMCIENLGSTGNSNGPAIPKDAPMRELRAVLTTNNSYTAKTDEEILNLSELNEDVIINGEPDKDSLYRVRFTGSFDISNICYAIIKPNCRCVVRQDGNKTIVTTAKFRTMNAFSKLIQRLSENIIIRVEVFRFDPDGSIHLLLDNKEADNLITFIQEDFRYQRIGRIINSLDYETNEQDGEEDSEIAFLKKKILELEARVERLEKKSCCLASFPCFDGDEYVESSDFYFPIVKKYVDKMNVYNLLGGEDGAPENEFDIESRQIAGRIHSGMGVEQIAKVIMEVFNKMFSLNGTVDNYMECAKGIKSELA